MKKTEITFHCDGFRPAHAAVNVKVQWPYGAKRESLIAQVGTDHGGDRAHMPAWSSFVEGLDDETTNAWNEEACLGGWYRLAEIAQEIFGPGYETTSEGRSSGWAVVTYNGRPTFDRDEVRGWDAVALAKWAKFAREARALAEDIPYQTYSGIYLNRYEPEADRRDAAAAIAGDDPFGLGVAS